MKNKYFSRNNYINDKSSDSKPNQTMNQIT